MSQEPVSDGQASQQRQPPERRAIIIRLLSALKRYENHRRRRSKQEKTDRDLTMARWTRRVGIFTAALVVVGIVTGIIFWRQSNVTQGQLDEMKAEQRPIIWTGRDLGTPQFYLAPSHKEGQVLWSVHYTNYGKSFVKTGSVKSYIKVGNRSFEQSYGQTEDAIPPISPNQDFFLDAISNPDIGQEEFDLLSETEKAFSVKFVFQYSDVAGNNYTTSFCLTKLLSGAITYCPADNYVR